MKKIYFDSNVYSDFVRLNISAEKVNRALSKNNFRLVISPQNMFETASCWKSGKPSDIQQGIDRFTFIKNLLPRQFFETIPNILLMELDKAINGTAVSPFVDKEDKEEYEREINKFTEGVYDNRAKNFIENRWIQKRDNIQNQVANLTKNKSIFNHANTFGKFFEENSHLHQRMIEGLIAKRVSNIPNRHRIKTAEKILRKPKRFPMIMTNMKANLFLDFRVLKFGRCSHDTLDDLRHLISASYATVFVTGDRRLYEYSTEICPELNLLSTDEFLSAIP